MKKYTKTLSILAVTAAAVSTASAVTYTWTGGDGIGGGGSGTNWYDVANWDGGVVPSQGSSKIASPIATAATDIAIFDSEKSLLGYMPTDNIDLVRVSGSFYPPSIDLRNGTLNLNRAENYAYGNTFTIGDGDLTTAAVFNMAATIDLNWAGSNLKTYVVNADGTLSFGANFEWSNSASQDAVLQLLGGAVTSSSTISGLTDDTGDYVSFEAAGSTFTAGFGGSFVDETAVTDAFGDSFRLGGALALDGSTLSYKDNGGTFTVSVVPEPSTTALLGLGGLALILRRRK
jgi:hypothetical protein